MACSCSASNRMPHSATTQLRWFRQRAQPLAGVATNIVAFPQAENRHQGPAAADESFALAS